MHLSHRTNETQTYCSTSQRRPACASKTLAHDTIRELETVRQRPESLESVLTNAEGRRARWLAINIHCKHSAQRLQHEAPINTASVLSKSPLVSFSTCIDLSGSSNRFGVLERWRETQGRDVVNDTQSHVGEHGQISSGSAHTYAWMRRKSGTINADIRRP